MTADDLERAIDAGMMTALSQAVVVASDALSDPERRDGAGGRLEEAWFNARAARRLAREVVGLPVKEIEL